MSAVPSNQKTRRLDIDILRIVAILFILIAHLPGYMSPGTTLATLEIYTVTLGLSIFIFISGYCLELSTGRITSWYKFRFFVSRRFLRIFPLYIAALLVFIVLFHYAGSYHRFDFAPVPEKALIHFFGLQALMSPRYPPLPTLWFIGLIVLFYAAYALMNLFSNTKKQIIIKGLVLFLLAIGIKCLTGLIDNRFFMYYPVFLSGIFFALENRPLLNNIDQGKLLSGALFLMVIAAVTLYPIRDKVYDTAGNVYLHSIAGEGLRLLLSFSGITTLYCLAKKYSSALSPRAIRILSALSLSC